ncbi:MAG: mevalonate kinase [Candidatus Saccharimonadaceae bacterium]
MSENKETLNNPFHSKIMLFGEYSIIYESMALTIPYSHFNGSLNFINKNQYTNLDFARSSNKQLREYYQKHLLPTAMKGDLPKKFNFKLLGKEIDEGLYFESSIPQGYGLGSSGALVAALYERYVEEGKSAPYSPTSLLDIPNLKRDLAILESWFHGTSSGLDPLICYMRQPLLIKEDQSILPIGIPRYNLTSDDAIFLINSGKSVKTAPLVDQFIKDCENPEFKNRIINEYIPLNNGCIQSLIDADIETFEKKVRTLSLFQATYFNRMIPSTLEMEWMFGITTGKFMLKLCGSGGGGFILGFTHHYKEVRERFSEKGFEIIPVYQYGAS